MKLNITKEQAAKILKAAVYLAISTVIGFFITVLTEQPELLGVYTPIVNVILVTIKQIFTDPSK